MTKPTFRLGEEAPSSQAFRSREELPPLRSSPVLFNVAGGNDNLVSILGSSRHSEAFQSCNSSTPSEACDRVSHFADYAAEHFKRCLQHIVARYEHDMSRLTLSGTLYSEDDGPGTPWARVQTGGSNSPAVHVTPQGVIGVAERASGHLRGGIGSGASPSNLFLRGNHSGMHTVPEDDQGGSSDASSHAESPMMQKWSAHEEGNLVSADSGLSQLAYGFHRVVTPAGAKDDYNSATSDEYDPVSSQAQNFGLPAWVAKTVAPSGRTFIEEKGWLHWLRTCFRPGRNNKKTVRKVVATQMRIGKDQHKPLDWCWAFFVFLNAIFVFMELQYFVTRHVVPDYVRLVSAGFTLVFTIELAFRFRVVRYSIRAFFTGRKSFWNTVDAFVILALWLEQVVRFLVTSEHSWLAWDVSILRIFRFFRLASAICKRMEALREIRLLFRVIGIALRSWFWILVFTSVIIYICSIFLAHGTYPLCNPKDGVVSIEHSDLCEHFGDFGRTFFTCYKATFGGLLWGDLVAAIEVAPFGYQVLFVGFVAFGVIIVANLAAGVLIGVHADGKRHDLECMIAEEERETSLFIEAMNEVFQEMDTNQSGAVSKEELELALEDPKMNALLRCYKLEMHDAHLLFDLLDVDNSNTIDVEEFIGGCLKMKGTAQAIDIVRLQIQMNEVHGKVHGWTTGALALEHSSNSWRAPASSIARADSRRSAGMVKNPSAASSGAAAGIVRTTSGGTMRTGSGRNVLPATPGVATDSWRGTSIMSGKSTMLSNMVPSWMGTRIPKAEERAMLLHELRVLRDHIRLHFTTWADERTRKGKLKLHKVNMYHVNYNWICPLTVPDGVTLGGLTLPGYVPHGVLVAQAPLHDGGAPRAIGEVMSCDSETEITVKVLRGQFDTRSEMSCENQSLGIPSRLRAPSAMSYKELVSNAAATPNWYCCHWWGEPIIDFLACIEEHSKLRQCSTSTSYWICAFANSQHDLGLELSDDPETSSFRRAMRVAQGVLLILDHEATPFQRIWCDYELYKTVLDPNKALDIVTVPMSKDKHGRRHPQVLADIPGESAFKKTQREGRFPIAVLAKGIHAKLEDGEATVVADKERILFHMKKEFQSERPDIRGTSRDDEMLENANQSLNAYFAWAAWPQALKHGLVRNFAAHGQAKLDLPVVTALEEGRKQLRLSLAHFDEVTDSALSDIVSGFPPTLMELSLSFEGCPNVSDRSLQHLARGLQAHKELVNLRLDFLGCKQITDLGLKALAGGLPPNLQRLRLDFAKCRTVGYVGVASLAQSLPSGLKDFSCTFKGTLVDQNFDSVEELRECLRNHAPTKLRDQHQTNAAGPSNSLSVRSLFG